MAIALDGSSHANGSASPFTINLTTTNATDVICVLITRNSGQVTSVSDNSGVSAAWAARYTSAAAFDIELWYTTTTGTWTGKTITITGAGINFITVDAFGVSGANTTTPFPNTVVTGAVDPVSITFAQSNGMVIGGFRMAGTSGFGSGYTGISNADFQISEYQIFSSPQTGLSVSLSPPSNSNGVVADFIQTASSAAISIGWRRGVYQEQVPARAFQSDAKTSFVPLFVTAKTPTSFWTPPLSDRERRPPIKENPDFGNRPWFIRSPNPVPSVFWTPPLSDRERLPPIKENFDPSKTWFLKSQIPVPTAFWLLPLSDREKLPPLKENPDPSKQWFVRSPNPVPTTWLPQPWDQPRPITNVSLEKSLFVRAPASTATPTTWLPQLYDQPRPVVNVSLEQFNFIKAPIAASVGISGMAWSVSKEEMRPPPPPDQYYVTWNPPQSPIVTFYAGSNADDFYPRPAQFRGDYGIGWTPIAPAGQVSTISGMAWQISKEEMRPPRPSLNPDEFRQWFVRSPIPVPFTWLPTAGERERLKPFLYEDRPPSFAFTPPIPTVGISGMAWYMPSEQIPRAYPGNTHQGWGVTWGLFLPPPPPPAIPGVSNQVTPLGAFTTFGLKWGL